MISTPAEHVPFETGKSKRNNWIQFFLNKSKFIQCKSINKYLLLISPSRVVVHVHNIRYANFLTNGKSRTLRKKFQKKYA